MANITAVVQKILCGRNFIDVKNAEEVLKKIIEEEEIKIEFWPMADASGIFWYGPSQKQPIITVNPLKEKQEQIFTLAHGLGHYFLEHKRQFCCVNQKQISLAEDQADIFAAVLLNSIEEVLATRQAEISA